MGIQHFLISMEKMLKGKAEWSGSPGREKGVRTTNTLLSDVSNQSQQDFHVFTYKIEYSESIGSNTFIKEVNTKMKKKSKIENFIKKTEGYFYSFFLLFFCRLYRLNLSFLYCLCFIVVVSISSPADIKLSSLKMRSFCTADTGNIPCWHTTN